MNLNCLLYQASDFFAVRRARRRLLRQPSRSKNAVWIDLHSRNLLQDGARYLNCLVMQLVETGYSVVLIERFDLAYELGRVAHGGELLANPDVYFAAQDAAVPSGAYVFTDSPVPTSRAKRTLPIRISLNASRVDGAHIYPLPPRPAVRRLMTFNRLARGRGRRRVGRLLVCHRSLRDRDSTSVSSFRHRELLHHLQARFGSQCGSPSTGQQQSITISNSSLAVHQADEWFESLSNYDFVLGCPEAAHPMSHDVIEGMSVGAIPLVDHAHCFSPHLTDGENAVIYSGSAGVEQAIRRVLGMDEVTIRDLRRGAIEYFDANLQPDKFLRRLMMSARLRGGAVLSLPYADHECDAPPSLTSEQETALRKRPITAAA